MSKRKLNYKCHRLPPLSFRITQLSNEVFKSTAKVKNWVEGNFHQDETPLEYLSDPYKIPHHAERYQEFEVQHLNSSGKPKVTRIIWSPEAKLYLR